MDRSLGFVLPRGLAIVGDDDDDDGRVSGLALCLLCFSFHLFFCPVLPVLDKTRTNRFQYTIQGLTVCKYFFRSKNAILELETRKPPPICHGLCGDQIRQKKKKGCAGRNPSPSRPAMEATQIATTTTIGRNQRNIDDCSDRLHILCSFIFKIQKGIGGLTYHQPCQPFFSFTRIKREKEARRHR